MTALDRIVIAALFIFAAILILGRNGPEDGRRPVPEPARTAPAPKTRGPLLPGAGELPPSAAETPPLERRRRPLLLDPAQSDPILEVASHDPGRGAVMLGTGFSIDRRGVWVTARHVASQICGEVVMVIDGRQIPASIAYQHPEADLVLLRTPTGKPSLPLSRERLAVDQTGFSFGYPTGVLGATQDTLMGRTRMRLGGRLSGITPTVSWAETLRFPDTLETLGGMSGGPMLDARGQVIGVVVAASPRRGRVHTVAPELLAQVQKETGLFSAAGAAGPAPDIVETAGGLRVAATDLSDKSRIAKIYCKIE
jgi:serine protease Do